MSNWDQSKALANLLQIASNCIEDPNFIYEGSCVAYSALDAAASSILHEKQFRNILKTHLDWDNETIAQVVDGVLQDSNKTSTAKNNNKKKCNKCN